MGGGYGGLGNGRGWNKVTGFVEGKGGKYVFYMLCYIF